jgi:hypothetical protein
MEHVLRNSLFLLMEQDRASLPDLPKLYANKDFRAALANRARNPTVRAFWQQEFARYPERMRMEVIAPILNKVGALLSDPTLFRILVAPKVDLRFRTLMDGGGGLIVNLGKGQIGEDSASTLGGILVSTIGLAALSRADAGEHARRPFFLYVDEFQNFTTLAFVNLLAEVRKYGLGLTLAHQHLHQLEPEVRHAVWGNAGTMIAFRVGAEDAPPLAREFAPAFEPIDLISLPNRHFYLRLMIDGAPSAPFSGRTFPTQLPLPPQRADSWS